MRGAASVLAGFAASLILGAGAQAATLTATYTGTVTSGHDVTGVFGTDNADLAGKAFEAVLTWDLDQAFRRQNPGAVEYANYLFGASGVFGVLTIDGQSMDFDDRRLATLHQSTFGGVSSHLSDRLPHPFDFDGQTYNYFTSIRDIFFNFNAPGMIPWYLTASYDLDGVGTGAFNLQAFDKPSQTVLWDAQASLKVTHLKVVCSGAACGAPEPGFIPEPATWALLILGFGLSGAALRNRRPALRQAVA